MSWPESTQARLDAAHRAIRILLGQVHAERATAAVALALEDDTEASVEMLAATGRLDHALGELARRAVHDSRLERPTQ